MGYQSAAEMAGMPISIEQQLTWHLTSNHYPPVPLSMIEPCMEAIDAIIMDEPNTLIELPDGITYRDSTHAPAWAIAEGHHLQAFIDSCEDDLL